MNRLGTVIRWRLLVATLLVAVVTLVSTALLAPSSEAASAANCSYYNNANHTTLVGQFGKDCCNNVIAWGSKTTFSECGSACFLCVPPGP